jgi:hypothetical protein
MYAVRFAEQQACGSKVAAPCYSFLKEKDKKNSKNSGAGRRTKPAIAQQHKREGRRTRPSFICCAMSRPTGREAFFFFLFSFKKCLFMKVYIVTENPCTLIGCEDLKLMTVRPELEAEFLKEYAGRIIASGSSIQDVLIQYNRLINDRS